MDIVVIVMSIVYIILAIALKKQGESVCFLIICNVCNL